ncbi:MAG TPA: sigma factor [Pirellulales bacterium]|jgi:RNA polymerase sigma-70 factor (ECF subfamily)|nr:sigma factor [Pirellulales bacterium]
MSAPDERTPATFAADEFRTTHWSLVLDAGNRASREAGAALAELCGRYWYPLYAYVRRRVKDVGEAQDLTQEFFARLLEKNVLAAASQERGRFRSFLLSAMKNFLANEWDKAKTQKRGGGRQLLPFALDTAESRLNLEPAHDLTPEKLYDRQWAMTLLELVVERLKTELAAEGKSRQFNLLKQALAGGRGAIDYTAVAGELDISEEAVRQTAHRLRRRYRELLREELAQTVADPADVDDEIRSLFTTLGS